MKVSDLIEDYDWKEAMTYADFEAEDIEKIIASSEGTRDEESWLLFVALKDGRYGWLSAGCDYTGWD